MRKAVVQVGSFMALAAVLSACTSTDVPLPQPAGGYSTIVFTRYTKIRDHAWNIYSFNAGTTLVADRRSKSGRTLYCGLVNLNDDLKPYNACFGLIAPSTLIIGVDAGFKEVERPQPAGTFRVEGRRV